MVRTHCAARGRLAVAVATFMAKLERTPPSLYFIIALGPSSHGQAATAKQSALTLTVRIRVCR